MKTIIVQALRAQAKEILLNLHGRGWPSVVKAAMKAAAEEYDRIADGLEQGTIQLREIGQLRTVK